MDTERSKRIEAVRALAVAGAARAKAVCSGVGEIAFLRDPLAGAVLLLGLALVAPAMLAHGLVAVLAAWLLASLARMSGAFLGHGIYLFNPLLSGLAVGHFFLPSGGTALLAAGAGMLAFVLTYCLASVLQKLVALPPLSLAFVLVSWCAQLAGAALGGGAGGPADGALGGAAGGFVPAPPDLVLASGPLEEALAALGYIFFVPDARFGLALAVLLARHSPLLLLSALVGLYSGAGWMWLLGEGFRMAPAPGFNFALLGMALGATFLTPSWRSMALAALVCLPALLLALALSKALGTLPGHALPYNLATLGTLCALGIAASPLLRRTPAATPEQALHSAAAAIRFPGAGLALERTVALPLAGEWTVLQGEDGPWTHQGPWRHAADFILCDESGFSHRGDGSRLVNYFAFGQPVLSPVSGVVAALRGDLEDCAPGSVDQGMAWGNHVIVYDERGFYVELSHLRQGSIQVVLGQRVLRGTPLAQVGNSGYSPQPHLHLQVQASALPGAASLPFCCVAFHQDGRFVPAGMPKMGAKVAPLLVDPALAQAMTFHPGDRMTFIASQDGREDGTVSIDISLAPDGSYCLRSGGSSLYVGRDEFRYLAYRLDGDSPALRAMLLALPSMPFGNGVGQGWDGRDGKSGRDGQDGREGWDDWVPAAMLGRGGFLRDLGALFFPRLALAHWQAMWNGARSVAGVWQIGGERIESTAVIDNHGIVYLRAGGFSMRRTFTPHQETATAGSGASAEDGVGLRFGLEIH